MSFEMLLGDMRRRGRGAPGPDASGHGWPGNISFRTNGN